MDISLIKPYEKNAKQHTGKQIDLIAKSIKRFGFLQPIVIDKNNEIVAGHGRYEGAKKLGLTDVPVVIAETLTDQEIKAYRLADNQINAMTGFDMGLVIPELKGLDTDLFDITGFDKDLLIEPDEKDDIVPENVPPVAQLGDIWTLGAHRVMCGDSTDKNAVERLMDGKKADMVFTDPPYFMDFTGSVHSDGSKSQNGNYGSIQNDKLSPEERDKFLDDFIGNIKEFTNGAFYICFYRLGLAWIFNSLERNNMRWRNLIIWQKNNHNLSNSDYKSLYEPIVRGELWEEEREDDEFADSVVYGWVKQHFWQGGKKWRDIWRVEKTKVNVGHPTQKPVQLITNAITNSCPTGCLVFDPFLGSGSTLIAAEKTGRICYGMELSETYCDVIIKRWEDYTGKKAEKVL